MTLRNKLVINFTIFIILLNVSPLAGISSHTTINTYPNPDLLVEDNLDGAVIHLAIPDNDEFDDGNARIWHFSLNNAPTGLTISSIWVDPDNTRNCYITLGFDGTDFDTDITNFSVTVDRNATKEEEHDITTDTMTIQAIIESSVSLTSTPSPLTESTLDGSTLHVALSGDTYVATIDSSQFTLNNAPTGTTINSINRIDDSNVNILLSFDGTDFDTDVNNLYVTVSSSALTTTGTNLNTNTISASGEIEPITSTASTIPYDLYENSLDGSHVILTITEDTFKTTLSSGDIQLINAPTGLSVTNVVTNSATEAEIILGFDGTDFDVDVSNFSIDVLSSGLDTAPSASSNTMTIQAVQEIEGITNYVAKGTSYPTLIEMIGYNPKNRKLYINSTLHTESDVTGKTATFNYYIKVYDGIGNTIGNLGDIENTLSITANAGDSDIDIRNKEVQLTQDFPTNYRIVVIVVSVSIS